MTRNQVALLLFAFISLRYIPDTSGTQSCAILEARNIAFAAYDGVKFIKR